MTADVPRVVAAEVILAVEQDSAFANLLLPRLSRSRRLSGLDAAFATELGYGTLRMQGVLDEVLAVAARRPVAGLDPPVRAVLRLGAYQLLRTRVPPHAAVSATVEVSKQLAGPRPTGLVNAVLRRVGESDWSQWVARLAPTDAVGRIAFEHGYPRWIADAWLDALDGDLTELRAALAADRPETHLVARPGRIRRQQLLDQAGSGATVGPWSEYAVRLGAGGDPAALPAIRDRSAGVQDEGSQLVALVLARALPDGRDHLWFDMCAGPGGKAAILAGLLPAHGRLVANDVAPHRAALVSGTVAGSGSTAVTAADARRPAWRPAGFDRVLLDAPCTGLGALRRRPEVRWRRRAADVVRLQQLQVELLERAIEAARPGGLVGYATCSPHRAETTEVVARVRASRPDVEPVDVRPLLPGVPRLGPGPALQLWPHRHGTDAMFMALLRRR